MIAALLAQGLEPFAAAAAGVLAARRGRPRWRRAALGAAEGVIATDVIEALPRARERELDGWERRCRGSDGGARRAQATRQRRGDRAQLRAPAHASCASGARLCAVVKADGYGHGAVRARARRSPAARAGWRSPTRGRRASCATAGCDVPVLVMGALERVELERGARGRRGRGRLERGATCEAVAAAGGGRVHVKLDSGMGRLGTRDPAEASRVVAAARATRPASSWPGR